MTENSIEAFYRAKSKDLVRLCEIMLYKRVINGVDAEDIVQKVVVIAWEKWHQLATHPNLLGWFVNACAKECGTLLRKDSYQRKHTGWPIPLSDNIPMDERQDVFLRWLSQMEDMELLSELKNKMTPLEQMVYEQYYVQEKSALETAKTLNLKVNAVNDAARRIRRRASKIHGGIFIFLLSPIFDLFCGILGEGRPWR